MFRHRAHDHVADSVIRKAGDRSEVTFLSSFRHDRPFAQYPLPLAGEAGWGSNAKPIELGVLHQGQAVIPATAGIQGLNSIGQ